MDHQLSDRWHLELGVILGERLPHTKVMPRAGLSSGPSAGSSAQPMGMGASVLKGPCLERPLQQALLSTLGRMCTAQCGLALPGGVPRLDGAGRRVCVSMSHSVHVPNPQL